MNLTARPLRLPLLLLALGLLLVAGACADSIGPAVLHGCIGVPDAVVLRWDDILPLGTPVVIG